MKKLTAFVLSLLLATAPLQAQTISGGGGSGGGGGGGAITSPLGTNTSAASVTVTAASDATFAKESGGNLATTATNTGTTATNTGTTATNTGTIAGAITANAMATISPVPTIANSSTYAHTGVTTAYAFGQAWLNNATAGSVTFNTVSVAKANDQAFTITGGLLKKSGTSTTNTIFRIHLFNAAPTTAVGDYGTFSGSLTMANWIGSMDCTVNIAGSDNSYGVCFPTIGTAISNTPVSGAKTVYWAPEVRAAYTPAASETLTLQLWAQ